MINLQATEIHMPSSAVEALVGDRRSHIIQQSLDASIGISTPFVEPKPGRGIQEPQNHMDLASHWRQCSEPLSFTWQSSCLKLLIAVTAAKPASSAGHIVTSTSL